MSGEAAVTEEATYTEVNWVVEASAHSRPWITMTNAGDKEELGRLSYQAWLDSRAAAGGSARYRLVKRTAVITDEVVEES